MDSTSGEFAAGTDAGGSIVRFFDLEGLAELLEMSCLVFHRWEGDEDRAFFRFVRERLPAALLRLTAEKPRASGKLERWWAAKERESQFEAVIASIRDLSIPPVAWIDSWYAEAEQDPVLWRLQEAAGRAIAVTSTAAALEAALRPQPAETVLVGAVTYDQPALPAQDLMHKAFGGEPTLAYEREVRAVLSVADAEAPGSEHAVAVEPVQLVQAVWLSPASSDRRLALVQRLLQRAGLDVPCRRASFLTAAVAEASAAGREVPLITHQPAAAMA